jgi:hypothetical protein
MPHSALHTIRHRQENPEAVVGAYNLSLLDLVPLGKSTLPAGKFDL